MDTFIERSNALLAARPNTTRISTRYTHKGVNRVYKESDFKPASVAIVKVYDPVSGTLFKHRVKRVNDLSRILRALGPYPIEAVQNGKTSSVKGLAALMADQEFAEEVPQAPQAQTSQPQNAQSAQAAPSTENAKPKKKKKSKK